MLATHEGLGGPNGIHPEYNQNEFLQQPKTVT